jgi:hypothetical protein
MSSKTNDTTTVMVSRQTAAELKRLQRRVNSKLPAHINYSLGSLIAELVLLYGPSLVSQLKERHSSTIKT